jgi:hypothetical protein
MKQEYKKEKNVFLFIKIKIYNLRNYFDVKRYNTIYIDEELKVDHCLGLVD